MVAEELRNIRLFLFDMDGTLYLGNQLFDFTKELLQTIRSRGDRYLFVTNNSSRSVLDYVAKLKRLGIAASESDFLTSSQATAWYLQRNFPGKVLYVCGTESLKRELRNQGFMVTENADACQCIVIGFDTELNFKKLEDVSRLLCTKELPYIATNPDYVCPTEFGSVPDCGSVCDMLYNVSGKRPFVVGKPQPYMAQLAMEKCGCTPAQTLVVGDRIYTDIKSGINAGCRTMLVMSGETTQKILDASEDKPDIVMGSARELLDILRG